MYALLFLFLRNLDKQVDMPTTLEECKKLCHDTRKDILDTIQSVVFMLPKNSSARQCTIKDWFLIDKDLGERCAKLLYNYCSQLINLKLFQDDEINEPWFHHLFCGNDVSDIIDKDGTAHIALKGLNDSINCQSLVRMADKLSKSTGISSDPLIEKYGKTTGDSVDNADPDEGKTPERDEIPSKGEAETSGTNSTNNAAKMTPKKFGHPSGLAGSGIPKEVGNTASEDKKSASNPQDSNKKGRNSEFNRFSKRVLEKYNDLKKYLKENPLGQHYNFVVAYCSTVGGLKKIIGCKSFEDAINKAYDLEDIQVDKDNFPVVCIEERSHAQVNRPSVSGTIHSKSGKKKVVFHIDTGADSGSVAFTCIEDLAKSDYRLTVQNVNGKEVPAVFCKVQIGDDQTSFSEKVRIFDLDPDDDNWYAIGLKTLQDCNCKITLYVNKKKIVTECKQDYKDPVAV